MSISKISESNKREFKAEMRVPSPSPSPSPVLPSSLSSLPKQPPRSQLKEYHIPSKDTYKYRSCTHPIEEICYITDNMELLPPDFKYAMLGLICYKGPKGPSVYSEYPAPSNIVTIEQINGRSGYFLKKTTKAAGIYLIWYDPKRNMYMFWGATEKEVRDAMNRIRGRIVKFVIHVQLNAASSQRIGGGGEEEKRQRAINRDIIGTPPPYSTTNNMPETFDEFVSHDKSIVRDVSYRHSAIPPFPFPPFPRLHPWWNVKK
jgi:hypothetical protein